MNHFDAPFETKPGTFFCQEHNADMPISLQSPDTRYCKECFDVLTEVLKVVRAKGVTKKLKWAPAVTVKDTSVKRLFGGL